MKKLKQAAAAAAEKLKTSKKTRLALAASVVAVAVLAMTVTHTPKADAADFKAADPRTTTLYLTSLSESVTVTGTVESSSTVNVTADLSGYSIEEISVQVGDKVYEGQTIALLNDEDLQESIAEEKEKISRNTASARTAYDKSVVRMNSAEDNALAAESEYNRALAASQKADAAFATAVAAVSHRQAEYDRAREKYRRAQNRKNIALARYNRALAGDDEARQQRAEKEYDSAKTRFDQRSGELDAALERLNTQKGAADYRQLKEAADRAQNRENTARTNLDNREKNYESAVTACENAKQILDNASTSDELEKLYDQLEKCTIKATSDGTITQLNVQVGDMVNGTIAVIQDTENLKISTSFEEYDIQNIELGMECVITSDANDKTLSGYVSQLSPVSGTDMNSDGTFSAEITINGTDHGLLIGMNAKAEVIISQKENIFVVPIDAVGTNENGEKVIYVQEGDTFRPFTVETGMETDYYIQIISDRLQEGMVVRSSADESESTAMTFEQENEQEQQMGSGEMSQVVYGRPSGGGMQARPVG